MAFFLDAFEASTLFGDDSEEVDVEGVLEFKDSAGGRGWYGPRPEEFDSLVEKVFVSETDVSQMV